jgi:hypothetical protein
MSMSESLHYGMGYATFVRVFGGGSVAADLLKMLLCGLVVVALWLTISACDRHGTEQYRSRERWFLATCMLVIVMARVTSLYRDIWNPDEAHILISSLNLKWDHRLWVAMDSTTLGPLCYLLPALLAVMLIPLKGGFEITLFTGRLCGMLLLMGAAFFLHRVAVKHVSQQFARLLTLAVVVYFCFSWNFEVQAYNSEYLFLFFSCAYLYVLEKIEEKPKASRIALAGLLIGLFPYIKLQVLPMAAMLGLWTIYVLVKATSIEECNTVATPRQGLKRIGTYCITALVPTVLLVGYVSAYPDGLSQATLFYLKNAAAHTTLPLISWRFIKHSIATLGGFYFTSWMGAALTTVVCIAATMGLYAVLLRRESSFLATIKTLDITWRFSLLLLLAALFAVARPGNRFGHYILFLVVPSFCFGMHTLRIADRWFSVESMRLVFCGALIWFIACFWAAPGNLSQATQAIKQIEALEAQRSAGSFSQLLRLIMDKTTPDDAIVVWGWEARINLYTQRRSATAQSDIQRLVHHRYPRKNTRIYIADILRNKPKLIVDVVAPGSFVFQDAAQYGIHTHGDVYAAIQDRYVLTDVITVEQADKSGSYRVYTRKD